MIGELFLNPVIPIIEDPLYIASIFYKRLHFKNRGKKKKFFFGIGIIKNHNFFYLQEKNVSPP